MERNGVLVIGSANMDLVISAERFPNPGETIFGNKFEMFPGGKGANQAVCSTKLGGKTYFIGKMGKDNFSKTLKENMENEGVDLAHLLLDENHNTGTALITVDGKGENEIIVISGSNMQLTPEDIESKKELFKKVKLVVCQLEIPIGTVLKSAQLAKDNNIPFILNPAPAAVLPQEIFSLIDYLTPNEMELSMLAGLQIKRDGSLKEASEKLLQKGIKNVIVTLGSKGAVLINNYTEKYFPAPSVEVVDTTGAGDAFNGALAYALANEDSIEKAIQLAISVASFSVTKMGAQSSMPKLEEVSTYFIEN
jgi:ribokinase